MVEASPDEIERLLDEIVNEREAETRLRRMRTVWRDFEARPEQLPPDGTWRTWYVRGGRGSGKTRTGAETLAEWIRSYPAGEWAVVAPTFGDAKTVCVENRKSGLLRVLGPDVASWNRSEGKITVSTGSTIYLDGADDGALRLQGRNLSGAWCDEVGLWRDWDRAWNYSLQPAVRFAPSRIVATGTPKMGHPLVAMLLAPSDLTVSTVLRTIDNVDNLDQSSVDQLFALYAGTTLGRQELDGEFIAAVEGAMLKRRDWRYYPVNQSFFRNDGKDPQYDARRYDQVVISWDTAVKDKESADFYSGQAWGCAKADRFLLRLWHGHSGFEEAKQAIRELHEWAAREFDYCAVRTVVEAAGIGPDIAKQLERDIQGVRCIASKGDKAQRAWAASPALESHNCFLPGQGRGDGENYEASQTPGAVQGFVEECAMFHPDLTHKSHDDQVDAWSQMVNFTRARGPVAAEMTYAEGYV